MCSPSHDDVSGHLSDQMCSGRCIHLSSKTPKVLDSISCGGRALRNFYSVTPEYSGTRPIRQSKLPLMLAL